MKGGLAVTDKKSQKLTLVFSGAVTAILLVVPFLINNYLLTILTSIMITALLGQSWNIMSGYAGQFSFGHAAFFGAGAYTTVILYVQYNISPWIGMIVGMAVAAVIGLIIGYLSFHCHIKGDYFALATLAFAEILRLLVYNSQDTMFGGPGGIFVTYIKGGSVKAFQFSSWKPYYYIILLFVIAVTVLIYFFRKMRFGLQLIAIRENEDAADALGVDILKYKLSAIALSAAVAALAGAFFAQYYLFIDSQSVFGSSISVQAIIPCIIGGSGTPFGPILGAFLIVPIQELTNSLFSNISGMNMIVYGVLIVLFILFCPNGIIGLFKKAFKKKGGAEK